MLSDFINFETAEILNNAVFGDDEEVYAAEDVETTNDNFLGVERHKKGERFSSTCENVHGKVYFAPTFAEVLDYLANMHKVYVEFTPWFTFALKDKIAYTYKVFKINEETAKLEKIFESDEWIASMGLCIQEIVKRIVA